MSDQHPRVPTNLEQQHKLAKDLLRHARDGDAAALARLKAVRPDAGSARSPQLADAQFAIACEAGFDSWPMLVAHLQERDLTAFRDAVSRGDVPTVQRLLGLPHVRDRVNAPQFEFGQRAAHIAAKRAPLLEVLIAAGADLNAQKRLGERTVHRPGQRLRGNGAVSPLAWSETDRERGCTTGLDRRAPAAACRRSRAGTRARRRREATAPRRGDRCDSRRAAGWRRRRECALRRP